jgi:hypothetical protein
MLVASTPPKKIKIRDHQGSSSSAAASSSS